MGRGLRAVLLSPFITQNLRRLVSLTAARISCP